MKFIVKIFEGMKYTSKEDAETTVIYDDVKDWRVLQGQEAEKLEEIIEEKNWDEYHEYLQLTFEDGRIATFRNSHAELFRY